MSSDEQNLRELFHNTAVPTQPPVDRVAAVRSRVRRSRLVGAGLAATAAGVVLTLGVPAALSWQGSAPLPPAAEGAALVVSATTAGCGSAASATPATLDQAANRLRDTAEKDFADSFTELEITDRVRVFRKSDAGFDAWVTDQFARDCVELIDVPYSGRENQDVRDRVNADRNYWSEMGIGINTLSVDITGTIKVGVNGGDLAEVKKEMSERYGRAVQAQEQGAVPPAVLFPS